MKEARCDLALTRKMRNRESGSLAQHMAMSDPGQAQLLHRMLQLDRGAHRYGFVKTHPAVADDPELGTVLHAPADNADDVVDGRARLVLLEDAACASIA